MMMAEAGFDPQQILDLMGVAIAREIILEEADNCGEFLFTHPR